ncbi:beta-ketoacyl synthase N-terminal-like domain-containing protein [Streptomyces sp. NPDC052109]|uniref:beta-ketoacyl synthase N-terminal-like domain-containing protein n=1 Tax=Streptomyces sp. NPDC052109 TaxID=3155527 RepID=UPI003415B744
MTYPLVLTGWSATSPLGRGARAFSEGLRGGHSGIRDCADGAADALPLPVKQAGLVPDFETRAVLGRKNTRSMDRATGLAVATVGMLLEDQRIAGAEPSGDGQDIGLVLGTTTGSAQSMMDFTRDSLTQDKPYLVDPARFPNTVMNCAAGQCAIWHGLRGPNTTIAGGKASGLSALGYAVRLHQCGHAETVLCGAVEEFSPQRAWLEWHARPESQGPPVLGEGCALLLVESAEAARRAGRPVLAELLTVGIRVALEDPRAALADALRTALAEAGVAAEDVWAVGLDTADGVSAAAVDDVFGTPAPRRISVEETIGDTGAASAVMQVAAVLSHAEDAPEARGRVALVPSVDRDGLVGCAVLRMPA